MHALCTDNSCAAKYTFPVTMFETDNTNILLLLVLLSKNSFWNSLLQVHFHLKETALCKIGKRKNLPISQDIKEILVY